MSMGGCALLLQNWAWYRLSCVAPESPNPWIFPLAQRFNSGGLNFGKVPHNNIEGYRKTIDHMMVDEFYWRPYLMFQHEVSEEEMVTWNACTYLHCFHIVEKHHTDRVTLQFGFHQQIPQPPEDMRAYHEVDMRHGVDDNWNWVWREEIQHWNEHHNYVLRGKIVEGLLCHIKEYMIWFRQHTKLFISVEQYLRDPRLQPPSYPSVSSTSQASPQQQNMTQPSLSSPHLHVPTTEVPYPPTTQYYVPVPEILTPGHPTEIGLFYNLFGTQCTTPESAYVVFDSMYNIPSQTYMEATGSGSNPPTTNVQDNDQDEPEEPQLVQRARRVRRNPRCGTGGHLGGHQ
uniref:Serine/threonine-protein phosphatase 7 long form homolog n=1 Tax=Cicer arietinum TaxID=3827 RepID=A0A3Q7YGB4_CICAR|nr:serine/threonine-protein phosphatase 7 long form homolog [Cicer arietinum]